jgi:hypothetical protein
MSGKAVSIGQQTRTTNKMLAWLGGKRNLLNRSKAHLQDSNVSRLQNKRARQSSPSDSHSALSKGTTGAPWAGVSSKRYQANSLDLVNCNGLTDAQTTSSAEQLGDLHMKRPMIAFTELQLRQDGMQPAAELSSEASVAQPKRSATQPHRSSMKQQQAVAGAAASLDLLMLSGGMCSRRC